MGSVVHVGPYTQVFDSPLPASPAQAAVVESFREGEVLWERSENAGRLVPQVRDFVTGRALTNLSTAMKAGKERGVVPGGVDRLFMTHVTLSGHGAIVATCEDGSKFKQVNTHTGKTDTRFPASPDQDYLFETWRMVRLGGHWALAALSLATLPSRSAEPCQPGLAGATLPPRPDMTALAGQMRAVLRAASSVHINGALQQGGKRVRVDVGTTRSGGFSGQISENGKVLTVLATRGHAYVKLTPTFLRDVHLPAGLCSRFCGKYLALAAKQSPQFSRSLSMATLTRQLLATPASKLKYLGVVTTGGQMAWLLRGSHGDWLYVAVHGKPYILRETAGTHGSVDLTQWDAVPVPGPPDQVVTASQLAASQQGTA